MNKHILSSMNPAPNLSKTLIIVITSLAPLPVPHHHHLNPTHPRLCRDLRLIILNMSPALQSTSPSLLTLPPPALQLIIRHAAEIPEGVLQPSPNSLRTILTLCRTSPSLRTATATAIHQLCFCDQSPWPSVKVLGPHAWQSLKVVDLTVDRSSMLAFLKWLIPATPLELRLRVTGPPYTQRRLSDLERVFLGRLFTNQGGALQVLHIQGIDCQALLFSALFQCTALREVDIHDYGDAAPATLLSVMSLLCLANRDWLTRVEAPWEEWKKRMQAIPDGAEFVNACKITWNTLWGSYRAGMKESAVNLPSGEDELAAKFREISTRMDKLSQRMDSLWDELQLIGQTIPADDVPMGVLKSLIPGLSRSPSKSP